jgi:hypothetical protein
MSCFIDSSYSPHGSEYKACQYQYNTTQYNYKCGLDCLAVLYHMYKHIQYVKYKYKMFLIVQQYCHHNIHNHMHQSANINMYGPAN